MLLLRHASAGERLQAASLDRARRLDRIGRADARELPEALAGHVIERVVSSPHARCLESVGALARGRNLRVEVRDELAPDGSVEEVLALLDELPDAALLCTHREVIERLFDGALTCEKGGTWLLERRNGRLEPAAYLPPPSVAVRASERAGSRPSPLGGATAAPCVLASASTREEGPHRLEPPRSLSSFWISADAISVLRVQPTVPP